MTFIRITDRLIRYRACDLDAYSASKEQAPAPTLPRTLPALESVTDRPCVYFVRSGQHGPIKIGHAKKLSARLNALRTAHHDVLYVLATMAGGVVQERRLHEQFAHLRLRGEWFKPAEELLSFIETVREPI